MRRRTYLRGIVAGGIVATAGCLDEKTGPLGNEYKSDIRTNYIGIAEESATEINNWYAERGDTTVQLSDSTELESGEIVTAQRWVDEVITQLPEDVFDIHYLDLETGEVIATSRPQLQPLQRSNGEFDFQHLSNIEAPWVTEELTFGTDNLYVSEPVYALRDSMVYFVTPVDTQRDGNIVFVMQTEFDVVLENLETETEGQFTFVIGDRGEIVARSREKRALNGGVPEFPKYVGDDVPDFIERGLQGESGFVDSFDRGGELDEPHIVAFAPVPDRDLVVATHVPESSI